MGYSPFALHGSTPAELQARRAADRSGVPFLLLRDGEDHQRIVALDGQRLTVGRSPVNDVALDWDEEVSRLHVILERVGDHWVAVDDGVSRNGTFVDGIAIGGRHRLVDGDVLRVGATSMLFLQPGATRMATTRLSETRETAASVTEAQRRVLLALCRPLKGGAPYAVPASNQAIAEDLNLTIAAVKTHVRTLSRKFDLETLPPHEKRLRLAALAFSAGIVSERDL